VSRPRISRAIAGTVHRRDDAFTRAARGPGAAWRPGGPDELMARSAELKPGRSAYPILVQP
jgi:hypothetical protein